MECCTCKRHYTQGGKCYENAKNCLFYQEEPRGKMISTSLTFEMNSEAKTPEIRPGSQVIFEEKGKEIEMTVEKINWINLKNMMCNVNVAYHEQEQPKFEKVKRFKIVKSKKENQKS